MRFQNPFIRVNIGTVRAKHFDDIFLSGRFSIGEVVFNTTRPSVSPCARACLWRYQSTR